jgi:hypothetical protein
MRFIKHYWQERIREVKIRNDDIALIQLIIVWTFNISILCVTYLK